MPCEVTTDKKGTLWRVPACLTKNPVKHTPSVEVDVWWDRSTKDKHSEMLVIRQDNADDRADVVMLSLGQAYDLIDALNKAVEGV